MKMEANGSSCAVRFAILTFKMGDVEDSYSPLSLFSVLDRHTKKKNIQLVVMKI